MFDCDVVCRFFKTNYCNGCKNCTYCGKRLYWSGKRQNIHGDHVLAHANNGSTIVPTCDDCNMSKGKKGLKEWLWWLIDNRTQKWLDIREYNKYKRNPIAQKIRDVHYQRTDN